MSNTNNEPVIHEARRFESVEDAIAFLQLHSFPQPNTIIIITPPPH